MDDGFSVFIGTYKEFSTCVSKFNALRKKITIDKWSFGNNVNFMDLFIYKDTDFFKKGKFALAL